MAKVYIKSTLIAKCGMNCSLCIAYLREKNQCEGCRSDGNRPNHCKVCKIVNCQISSGKFCYSCEKYPCSRLKRLDKRYRSKYGMSMIDNLNLIEDIGLRNFTRREKERWKCRSCGYVICVHRDSCINCGDKRKK